MRIAPFDAQHRIGGTDADIGIRVVEQSGEKGQILVPAHFRQGRDPLIFSSQRLPQQQYGLSMNGHSMKRLIHPGGHRAIGCVGRDGRQS